MPPVFRNHPDSTAWDTPPSRAASSLVRPAAIASQKRRRSSRFANPGRPGDRSGGLIALFAPRFRTAIATSITEPSRQPVETALPAPVAVVHEPALAQWAALMESLLESIENEVRSG